MASLNAVKGQNRPRLQPFQEEVLKNWSGKLSVSAGEAPGGVMVIRSRQAGATAELEKIRGQRVSIIFVEDALPVPSIFAIQQGSAQAIVEQIPIPVSIWLQSQPGSTRRGYARGRFQLPKNVFV